LSSRSNSGTHALRIGVAVLAILGVAGCSSNPADAPPPTIPAATAAVSPPQTTAPDGEVRPLDTATQAAEVDAASGSLVVLGPGPDGQSTLTVFSDTPTPASVSLPGEATAMTGDDDGAVYLSTRGGYFRVDITDDTVTRFDVEGQQDTEFTAIARHDDGRLVLGSADGGVYTLDSDTTVGGEVTSFVRVDALVTQGGDRVVLDRAQSLVTTVDNSGRNPRHALRAGDGATTLATDPAGRVLVADTRGGELLVFSVDPLLMRQRYPVPDSPYGLAGSRSLTWVSQTATNTVIGYDLATGIPVERIRYRTVQQPNALAFDDASGTLYVVSGSGAGVQIISDAVVSG
jgi:hypothetical protein